MPLLRLIAAVFCHLRYDAAAITRAAIAFRRYAMSWLQRCYLRHYYITLPSPPLLPALRCSFRFFAAATLATIRLMAAVDAMIDAMLRFRCFRRRAAAAMLALVYF